MLLERLRELGWNEGRNLAIEYRWAKNRTKRNANIAAEFVRLKVDVKHGTPTCFTLWSTSQIADGLIGYAGNSATRDNLETYRATNRGVPVAAETCD